MTQRRWRRPKARRPDQQ